MPNEANEWTDREVESLQRKYRSIYGQASSEMRQRLEEFMADFDKQNADWKKRLSAGEVTRREYDDWLRDMATDRSWIDGMARRLASDAVNADKLAVDALRGMLPAVYAENANMAAFEVEKGIGVRTGMFDLYDEDTVRRLIIDEPDLLPPVKVDGNRDFRWNRQKMSSAITQSILQGESIPRAAARLRGVLGMDERSAISAARTAITGAENAGRIDSYKRAIGMGIKMEQQWMATLDQRTRHSHKELDGQHVPVGEKFKVDGIELEYPADPSAPPEYVYNCRCTLVAWFPDIEQEDPERWSKLPKGMTYDEWKNERKTEKNRQEKAGVVNGRDILGTWKRREDKFDFEIEDVLNAQGFDGKPRVVSAEEFDAAVKAANNGNGFIAQRTYSAPDQETLDAYRRQLYDGKWYVDCSTGGAQYGQGMYCAADYTGTLTDGIKSEMQHYIELGVQRNQFTTFDMLSESRQSEMITNEVRALGLTGDKARAAEAIMRNELQVEALSWGQMVEAHEIVGDVDYMSAVSRLRAYRSEPVHYVETLTLDPSARTIDYHDLMSMKSERSAAIPNIVRGNAIAEHAEELGEEGVEFARRLTGIDDFDFARMGELYEQITPQQQQLANEIANGCLQEITDAQRQITQMDPGAFAAAQGYDAINAEGHGASGSYTVVLNRTKLIIKEPE